MPNWEFRYEQQVKMDERVEMVNFGGSTIIAAEKESTTQWRSILLWDMFTGALLLAEKIPWIAGCMAGERRNCQVTGDCALCLGASDLYGSAHPS